MITGHLQEKNGRFYMVLNLYVDGKWKPKWISTRLATKGNKRNAEAMLRDTIQRYEDEELEVGEGVGVGNVPFTEFLANWLKLIKPQVEACTFMGYKRLMERQIIPYFEPMELRLRDVEPRHIKNYYDYLQVEGGRSANTVKHHHANIRKALQSAVLSGYIPSNPADRVEKPKIKPYIASTYNKEELQELFYICEGKNLELPVLIAAYYGLRCGEVCGLRWDAIDFQEGTIAIKHVISKGLDENDKEVLVKRNRTKNKSSYRTLPLIPFIKEKLLERKAWNAEMRRKHGNSYDVEHTGYVFTGKLGALLTPANLSRYFRQMLAEYGLRHIRFHDLRHSCASLLLANGISMKEIQDWMGHSSYSTTANIYAHLDSHSKNASADMIASVLKPKAETSFNKTAEIKRKKPKGQKEKEPVRKNKIA
ncbi:tyrosine-type recombinase/integrase [Ruminococcaceae bacterium OttesenSCG-928-A16]|nr:tyrosine-type recombinase/integrase [Ruminococcaceae bacterium OttesenSCG-928-A16]